MTWRRIELKTDGGPLPFVVEVVEAPERDSDDLVYSASIINGAERIPVRIRTREGGYEGPPESLIAFPHYDSWVLMSGANADRTSSTLAHFMGSGGWMKKRGGKYASVHAESKSAQSAHDRFDPIDSGGERGDPSGRWRVTFSSSADDAVGEFAVDPKTGLATGTFLTTTGDYRFLEGRLDGNLLRLSTFDGAHAFLFKAALQPDGSLKGDFWSGNWWHETWTAVRDEDATLPDAMGQTTWRSDTDLDELIFTDLEGNPTSVAQAMDALDDEGARATVLLVFGSWCPNCADATEYLVKLQAKYHARGLRVLGLAFELTGDLERDAGQVRIHQEHHDADWPVLVAGLSDKAKASEALPVLDKVRSYPTTIFMGPDREPKGIWTGFAGPATGQAHQDLRTRWEAMIERLLDAEASDSDGERAGEHPVEYLEGSTE
ncbi:MAG: TlpA family protein disulfide reductase [Phycisphaerales bacterium JB059]